MPATAEALAAQRCALALVNAVRHRDLLPPDTVVAMLRAANHEHHPVSIELALAALMPAVAGNLEAQVRDLLADTELLAAALAAARAGLPLEPASVGITAAGALEHLGTAATLQEPD